MVIRRLRFQAFTLIELLVVIAIIALLVSILVPSLSKARALAKRASCEMQMNGLGKASGIWVGETGEYPYFAPGFGKDPTGYGVHIDGLADGTYKGCAWPKIFNIMQANGMKGTRRTTGAYDMWAYDWTPKEVWKGALCPAMDAEKIWAWSAKYSLPVPSIGKFDLHKAAIGFQWNPCLRARIKNDYFIHCDAGRFNNKLELPGTHAASDQHITCWMDYLVYPAGTGNVDYAAQAIRPSEVYNPSRVAEGWDSNDLETTPNINVAAPAPTCWDIENLAPGWDVGPFNYLTGGIALLNAYRHQGSPVILYADGHVAADATRTINASDLPAAPGSWGSWAGLKCTTWSDWDPRWGTLQHIVPNLSYYP